jgi:hypothetical protein
MMARLRATVVAPVSMFKAPAQRCSACVWAWLLTPVALYPDDGATDPIPRQDRDAFPILLIPGPAVSHPAASPCLGTAVCLVGVVVT